MINRQILYPLLTILVFAACSLQKQVPVVPLHQPTVTAMFIPTPGPVQVETPDAQFYTSGEPKGFIRIPGVGDAGNYFLDAGSTITLTWNDPPLDSARYDFTISDYSGMPVVIGTDVDAIDGVAILWLVPEDLPGYEIDGIAYDADGQPTYFAYGGTIYSHEAPSQTICTLANRTIGALPVHLEPDPSSQIFANLIAGEYVQVYEQKPGDWYQIDANKLEIFSNTTLICGESPTSPCRGFSDSPTGWVQARGNVRFFGPCERFSN